MKSLKRTITFCIVIVLALIAFGLCAYTVQPNNAAIVTRMSRIQYVETEPGMHFHAPFIEVVTDLYTGDILYDIPESDVITADKKTMIADDYVIWAITDATKCYQTLGGIQARVEERIEAAVYNATKNTISSMTQDEIIAARGNTLTEIITKEANSDISQYGIEIKIAEIKALDLPADNKAAVYERMISERSNIAASFTAQGNSAAQKIRNETDKQVSITMANAEAEAAKIIAEGEAEYMRILSDAYNSEEKAEFYNFLRGLDAISAMSGENKTLILDKDSEYARLLYGIQ